jgi:transcriptional regulator with XRE-family HTH domain
MVTLAEYIKQARLDQEISQSALARLTNTSPSMICKLERNKLEYPPSADILRRIAYVLDIDVEELLRVAGRQDMYVDLLNILLEKYPELPKLLKKLKEDKAYTRRLIKALG